MAIKEVLVYPNHPILTQRAHKVRGIDRAQVRQIVQDLVDTSVDRNAAGLAAPQIGIAYRIIVVKHDGGYLGMINPEITLATGSAVRDEACLSLPGLSIPVVRATKIKVKTDNGKYLLTDDLARVVQHEIDHLNGVLILHKEYRPKEAGLASA